MPLDQIGPAMQTPAMDTGQSAELSSVATQLEDLALRVSALSAEDDPIRAMDRPALLEVERHLRGAMRELERFRRSASGA